MKTSRQERLVNKDLDEGLTSLLTGKLGDLAKGLIFKPRPIVVLYDVKGDKVVSFKIRRGMIRHSLIVSEGDVDKTVARDSSSIRLVSMLLQRVEELKRKGYVEI